MTTTAPATARPETLEQAGVSRRSLWFGLVGGVVGWLLHFLLVYLIAEFGCVRQWDQYRWMNISAVAWGVIGATVLTAGLTGLAILVALRSRRRLGDETHDAPGEPGTLTAARWMAFTGFVAGVISLLVILVQTLPILYWLQDC